MTVAGVEQANGFTPEQRDAIERRDGELFLDAGAGSGKTSVLVERFVRGVLQDGLEPGAILTITFTEKAAAEMRERIRQRLRELGAPDAARATPGPPWSAAEYASSATLDIRGYDAPCMTGNEVISRCGKRRDSVQDRPNVQPPKEKPRG